MSWAELDTEASRKLLRFSLFIVLCNRNALLKCHGEAAAIYADAGTPILIPVPDQLQMTKRMNETVMTSRTRRSLNSDFAVNTLQFGMVPGIAESRYTVLTPPYKDGKECGTGQDPFSTEEATKAADYFAKPVKHIRNDGNGYTWHAYPIFVEQKNLLRESEGNCKSKKCHFDPARMSYVCGPPTKRSFEDGTNCRDGSKVPKKDTVKYRYDISNSDQNKFNQAVKNAYGKNCKSGKCYYHFHKDVQICEATSLVTSWYICLLGFFLFIFQYYEVLEVLNPTE